MNEKQLHQALDNLSRRAMPDDKDLWFDLNARIAKPPRRYLSLTTIRLAFVIMLLIISAAVYAVFQFQTNDPGLQPQQTLITPLGISQTIDDLTLTLDWAYADANRIVIAYTYTGKANVLDRIQSHPDDVHLTDGEGNFFQWIKAIEMKRLAPDTLSLERHFDASIITDHPQSLNLQLVAKAFTFDFNVPFIPGVLIQGTHTVTVDGITVTLQQALITPTMVSINFCYDRAGWYPGVVRMRLNGKRTGEGYSHKSPVVDETGRLCKDWYFLLPFDQSPAHLTFTILSFQTPTYYSRENMERAAATLKTFGIEAEVIRNQVSERESYMLNITKPADNPELAEHAWDTALASIGEPLEGERIDGPWVFEITLP